MKQNPILGQCLKYHPLFYRNAFSPDRI